MEGGRARSKGPFRLQCGWGVAFSWELREVIEELKPGKEVIFFRL